MKYKVEPYDLFFGVSIDGYDPVVRTRIDFEGALDISALKQAVTLSLRTLPIMACRFHVGRFRPRWVPTGLTGEELVTSVAANGQKEALVTGFFIGPYNLSEEPQLSILLIQDEEGDTLCIKSSHIVCDGTGTKEYCFLLASLYSAVAKGEEPPAPVRSPRGLAPLLGDVPRAEKKWLMRELDKKIFARAVESERQKEKILPEQYEPRIVRRVIEPKDWMAFRQFAKREGLTLNDLLSASIARAQTRETGNQDVLMNITVDNRRLIPPNRPYGLTNYSVSASFNFEVTPGESLSDTARKLSSIMEFVKQDRHMLHPTLWYAKVHSLVPFFMWSWFIKKEGGALPWYIFSNLGVFDKEKLRFGDVEACDAGMMGYLHRDRGNLLTATTFGDHCTLLNPVFSTDERIEIAETTMQYMHDEIVSAAGNRDVPA
jgi:NRPS condensation-like uncharacterized protein